MTYPSNSREVAFLPIAECRTGFATLVRELDKLDEHGAFGPEGWRTWLTPLPQPLSMSKALRDANARLDTDDETCSGLVQREDARSWPAKSEFDSLDRSQPALDKSEVIVVT